MARGGEPLTLELRVTVLPGLLALALVLGTVAAGLAGLLLATGPEGHGLPWPYVGSVLRFTLLQAMFSTLFSLTLGAALALALVRRRRFAGRGLFIAAMNLASVLPAVVAVFGILAVLGRAGWAGQAARALGFDAGGWVYGLPGILIAHVFFNAPLAARIFLAALAAVPGEHWRLAGQLGMPPGAVFRLIDWPVLQREAPPVAALIFLLAFTSFAIVLTLGGGPRAATLEVAIYSAVRFDVDLARAGLLALLQVAVCLIVALPILWLARRPAESAVAGHAVPRPDTAARAVRIWDFAALVAGAGLIVPPLMAVLVYGIAGWRSLADLHVLRATATSFAIAGPAALLSVGWAVALAAAARAVRPGVGWRGAARRLVSLPAALALAVPPVGLSAGLFVVLRPVADPFALAVPLIVWVNALLALPFVLRQIEPPLMLSGERYGRLADSLGVRGWSRLRLVDWPLLRAPLLAAFAIAAALSFGDLGVAAFFGTGNVVTLPLLLYERMGAYRMSDAASVSLLLAVLVFALFSAAQRWSGEAIARSR